MGTMSQSEWFTSYLEYESLKDMLKVILYPSQAMFGFVPMLYHITYNERQIIFIQTGMVGGVIVHYFVQDAKPDKHEAFLLFIATSTTDLFVYRRTLAFLVSRGSISRMLSSADK